jgi:hypothetical protein
MPQEQVIDQAEAVDLSMQEAHDMLLARTEKASAPDAEAEDATQAPEVEEGADDAEQQSDESDDAEEATAQEESEEEDSEEPEAQLYVVKVQGEEQQVTLDELLNGYSRTADYQRKTQATAELRKQTEANQQALDAERQSLKAEREWCAQILSQADEAAKAQSEVQVDMAKLKAGDKEEQAKFFERQEARERRQMVAHEQQRVTAAQEQEQAQMQAQAYERITTSLSEPETGLPGWTDPAKRDADIDSMESMLVEMGFQPKALQALSMIEPFVRVAHDALTLRAMKSSKPKLTKKAPAKPPIRAGAASSSTSSRSKELERATKRVSESDSIDNVAELLLLRGRRK